MRQPTTTIYVYWLQDVSGEWLFQTDTNRADLSKRNAADRRAGYKTTQIEPYRGRVTR